MFNRIDSMSRKYLIFAVILSFVCINANADQCAYINKKTTDAAYSILKSVDNYIDFCAPCGDSEPVEKKIDKLEYKQVDYVEDGIRFYQIYINDEPMDMAYVYVNRKNLGMMANCEPMPRQKVQSVPEYIDDYLIGKWTLPKEHMPE
ncbi:MAG: hypothetical protein LBK26_03690 [Rickettsiales bacterium]|jgi:hypothetical protein|nr:hypothetical protein [Rickettsiales bacterium]